MLIPLYGIAPIFMKTRLCLLVTYIVYKCIVFHTHTEHNIVSYACALCIILLCLVLYYVHNAMHVLCIIPVLYARVAYEYYDLER